MEGMGRWRPPTALCWPRYRQLALTGVAYTLPVAYRARPLGVCGFQATVACCSHPWGQGRQVLKCTRPATGGVGVRVVGTLGVMCMCVNVPSPLAGAHQVGLASYTTCVPHTGRTPLPSGWLRLVCTHTSEAGVMLQHLPHQASATMEVAQGPQCPLPGDTQGWTG